MQEANDPQVDRIEPGANFDKLPDVDDGATRNNLLEVLREKYANLGEEKFYDIILPGWDGILKVRFNNSLTWPQVTDIIKKAEKNRKNPMATLFAQCDLLIRSTDSIWARVNEESPWGRLDSPPGVPVGWTTDLAALFGIEGLSTGRDVIRAIFKKDIRLGAAQGMLMEWIQGLDEDSGEEVEGEF